MNTKSFRFLAVCFLLLVITVTFSVSPYDLADEDSRFINLKGIDIHYKVEGNFDKVMFMFHGFGSSTFTWTFIQDAFLSEFTLLAYDRPTFGLTQRVIDVGKADFNYYNFFNQSIIAHELINAIGINPKQLLLVGHSAGTPVLLDYYQHFPKNINGLILLSPALEHKLDQNPFAKTFSNPLVRGTVSLFKNLLARTLEGGLDESWYDTSKITDEIRSEYKKFTMIDDWEKALIEFTLNQGDFDMLPALAQIDIPVLVLFGTADKIVASEQVKETAEINQNITVVFISETGHVPQEESPSIVINEIKEWMARYSLD